MALRQFLSGSTYSLIFDFFTSAGVRTSVASPAITIFTPERATFVSTTTGVSAVAGTTGRYQYSLAVTAAMTVGTWMSVMTGTTASSALFSSRLTFNVTDFSRTPIWLGLEDFREYIEEPDDVHTYDSLFERILTASMQLVEEFTQPWGQWRASEVRQIRSADRMLLRAGYPVVAITGLTVTDGYTPSTPQALGSETAPGNTVTFYYRLDKPTGTLIFTDSIGFESYYEDVIIVVDALMGDGTVPEPMRLLALYWASKILNLHQNEGLDNVRIADVNFALRKGLLDDTARDLLINYTPTHV